MSQFKKGKDVIHLEDCRRNRVGKKLSGWELHVLKDNTRRRDPEASRGGRTDFAGRYQLFRAGVPSENAREIVWGDNSKVRHIILKSDPIPKKKRLKRKGRKKN